MKILTNGHFISCEDENRCFSVMVIDQDKIIYTGDTVPEEYAECPAIDMHGYTVVPAFSDTREFDSLIMGQVLAGRIKPVFFCQIFFVLL